MLDVLLCYGFAANMIRAGYLGLVTDLFRQFWDSCRPLRAAAAVIARRPSQSDARHLRCAGTIILRRLSRRETYVTSMR
jgi:hypothetical protein